MCIRDSQYSLGIYRRIYPAAGVRNIPAIFQYFRHLAVKGLNIKYDKLTNTMQYSPYVLVIIQKKSAENINSQNLQVCKIKIN